MAQLRGAVVVDSYKGGPQQHHERRRGCCRRHDARALGAKRGGGCSAREQLLIKHIGTTMAREHTQLFLARLHLTSPLTLQRANRVPSAAASTLRARLSQRCCAGAAAGLFGGAGVD